MTHNTTTMKENPMCGCLDPGHEDECLTADCFCCCGHTEAQHTDDGCVGPHANEEPT